MSYPTVVFVTPYKPQTVKDLNYMRSPAARFKKFQMLRRRSSLGLNGLQGLG